jgi:tetratricopeptide (TPR) repeat protein
MPVASPSAPPPAWIEELIRNGHEARRVGRYALALAIYRRVVAAAPAHGPALQHLGALLTVLGRRSEAEAALRQALEVDPGNAFARHALALTLMAQGRYAEAWADYEARFEVSQLGLKKPSLPVPEWRGEDVAGKRVLIVSEMGFGDQIQHARFAALLRDRGATVCLVCRPGLVRLFADSLEGVQVAASGGDVEFRKPDYWTMSGSLAGLTGVTPETVPGAPYLRALQTGERQPEGFKVGLVTAGDPAHGNDANRSLRATEAERLRASLPGRVIDLSPAATGARDFADTASILAELDLIVTVDTAAAHLAGALGKRAFVLIPALSTDWRWMHDRDDTPWYPSLRLYRGDPKRGWAAALERLVGDAQALAAGS